MNRSVLEGITIFQGEYYANDALQYILGNLIPDYRSGFIEKPKIEDCHGKADHEVKMFVFNNRMEALSLLVNMFDAIVENGKEKTLQFIKDNKRWLKEA